MKQSLEEATAFSRKGYIGDHDEIDSIFTKLLGTPISQLGGIEPKDTAFHIDLLFDLWDITSNENTRSELTTGEFIALTEGFRVEPIVESPDDKDYSEHCCYAFLNCLENHLRAAVNNNARLFLCCGINDFLRYAAEKADYSICAITTFYRIFKRDVYDTMKFSITDSTTLNEYMRKLMEFQRTQWIPCKPISEFESMIKGSYDEFAYLMIKSTKLAFPEMFDIKAITQKYGNAERNDG